MASSRERMVEPLMVTVDAWHHIVKIEDLTLRKKWFMMKLKDESL
jgi:hypothetical protein